MSLFGISEGESIGAEYRHKAQDGIARSLMEEERDQTKHVRQNPSALLTPRRHLYK